ncbi:MAG TPA: hypothetical protein PK068_10310, partial [Nitrosomonas sp.]|nr:hypothetical protein [Nitrosomonas sp.]
TFIFLNIFYVRNFYTRIALEQFSSEVRHVVLLMISTQISVRKSVELFYSYRLILIERIEVAFIIYKNQ